MTAQQSLQVLSLKRPEQVNFNQRTVFQDNFLMIFGVGNCGLESCSNPKTCDMGLQGCIFLFLLKKIRCYVCVS